jgi:DNA-binding HxlR family transcriptional regulator
LGKPQIRNRNIEVVMSQANLAKLHDLLQDPVRQKILLKLSRHERLSFEDLKGELKTVGAEELKSQLKILADLITQSQDDEFLLTETGVSKRPIGQYALTEKGHNAVDEMLAFPEITAENYREKVTQQ